MDLDEFRTLFESSGVDIWTVIDMAITVASMDYCKEFKAKRDDIVARLYATTTSRCYNCHTDAARLSASEIKPKHKSRIMEESHEREGSHDGEIQNSPRTLFLHSDEDEDLTQGDLDESQEENLVVTEVLRIKELLEDPDQPQETLIELLQSLLNMHISVEALKETDIGRQVNGLRKHSSSEIRKLVKQVIRKWKDLVDEWVNTAGEVAAAAIVDGDSPQGGATISTQNSLQKYQGSNYLPSPDGRGSDCNGNKMNADTNSKGKRVKQSSESCDNDTRAGNRASREYGQLNGVDSEIRKGQAKQKPPVSKAGLTQNMSDSERLASAKKRLQEKYQEVQNAKKQRTIQVMELQDLPKARNTYIPHGKGGNQSKHRFYGK